MTVSLRGCVRRKGPREGNPWKWAVSHVPNRQLCFPYYQIVTDLITWLNYTPFNKCTSVKIRHTHFHKQDFGLFFFCSQENGKTSNTGSWILKWRHCESEGLPKATVQRDQPWFSTAAQRWRKEKAEAWAAGCNAPSSCWGGGGSVPPSQGRSAGAVPAAASCQLGGSYEHITVSSGWGPGLLTAASSAMPANRAANLPDSSSKRRRNPAPSAHPREPTRTLASPRSGPFGSHSHTPHLSPRPPRSWPRPAREAGWGLGDSLWCALLSLTHNEAVYTTVGGRLAVHLHPSPR